MKVTGSIPSVQDSMDILNMYNGMMPQYFDYDLVVYNACRTRALMSPLREAFEDLTHSKASTQDLRTELRNWVTEHNHTALFPPTKTGIGTDQESIEGILADEKCPRDVRDVLTVFRAYSELMSARKALFSLLQNPISDKLSCDRHRMIETSPIWVPQNTGRLGMQKPAIQNIPRNLQCLQTVPLGYVYVHADSGQMEPITAISWILKDPLITKLYYAYMDAYYAYLHYAHFHDTLPKDPSAEITPFEIDDNLKAMRQTLKTFVNAVMYGSTSNPTNNPIKTSIIKYLGNHPARLAHVRYLRGILNKGELPRTYFGNPIDIYKSEKLKEENAYNYDDQVMKLAINNPIQGTGADLMRYSVRHVTDMLMTHSRKSRIINYVHDAVSLAIYEDDFDKVRPHLDDLVAYEIDGFIPIRQDLQIGRATHE